MINTDRINEAILEEDLSGWLFFNFRHRDPVSDEVLEINPETINSRGWFYIISPYRNPLKIVHRVEHEALDHLPGDTVQYSSRSELISVLSRFKGEKIAVQADRNLTALSYLDAGTADLLKTSGIITQSASVLIQKYLGLLDENRINSHEKAGVILYSAVEETWNLVKDLFSKNNKITEKLLADFIHDYFRKNKLETEHRILVAFGKNTSDPHYETGKKDRTLEENTLIQFDLWAKEKKQNSVYADISWVAYSGKSVPDKYTSVFKTLTGVRDFAVSMISERIAEGRTVTGSEVDSEVRNILISKGYQKAIRHRTGHAIDRELHGYGVNIDSVEFPDSRKINSGSCFSIEPGLYFSDFGMRTEIDCYIKNKALIISGKKPQEKILTI